MSAVRDPTGTYGTRPAAVPDRRDRGAGLVLVSEQLVEFGGVERILHTLMARYPESRVIAGRFDARAGLHSDDFEQRALGQGIELETPAGEPRIQLLGPGGTRSHFLSPLYARRLSALPLDGAETVISLGGTAWTLAARVPRGSRHVGYVGGPPRALYHHTDSYLAQYPRSSRPLLRAAIPALRAHHRRLLQRPDVLVTNARDCARGLAELAGRDVGVVYPPVRSGYFTPAPRRREHFLAVARLFKHKRMDVLVEAFRRLPGERLVVAGAGPALAELRAAAPPNVSFVGSAREADLLELYRASRAVVTASVEEFGISAVEALATGIPVIGPRAGGTGEIVDDGQTGVLFDRVDPDSVARAVRRFLLTDIDPSTCRRSGERFSEERFLAALEPVLGRPA